MQEGTAYFSEKHKLYGLKDEVAVLCNGIASALSKHCPGSTSDLTIIHERIKEHIARVNKKEDKDCYEYTFFLSNKYPNQWAVLMDK